MSHAQDASSRANVAELQAGEVIACRYRVESHDRTHPLGELYRCRDQDTDKLVSLQRLRREFAQPGVQDRLFETRGSASLQSKVIADILDYGEDIDGRTFLVTPRCEHSSLSTIERPLPFFEAVLIVERVAAALAPLHKKGLFHGGIEPASVLVDGERELTGLLGFGLAPALAAAAQRGRALPLLASPAYAAPELIKGETIGPQTDVYALGILLWELIFGQPPFLGPTLRVLDSHVNRLLPDIELPFDAPAGLEWTLGWMLAKNPAERFSDAGKVAEQLRALMLEEPEVLDAEPELIEAEPELLEAKPELSEAKPELIEAEPVEDEVPRIAVHSEVLDDGSELFDVVPGRVWPKLTLVAGMCASLVLLSIWGFGRDRAEVVADQATVEEPDQRTLSSASRIDPPASEAVPKQPTLEQPMQSKQRTTPSLREIKSSKFRAQKDELYGSIDRACTEGGVRRTLKVAVRVDGRGRVAAATVLGKMGSSKLGQCVERQARKLDFPASQEGGYYVYTLRLR